jgi:hypothetical protein
MQQLNRRHVLQLRETLARYGWPGKSLVGVKAAGAAWIIAQHADAPVLAEMLPLMYAAVKKRELEEGLYATSLDRVLASMNAGSAKPIDDPRGDGNAGGVQGAALQAVHGKAAVGGIAAAQATAAAVRGAPCSTLSIR